MHKRVVRILNYEPGVENHHFLQLLRTNKEVIFMLQIEELCLML